MFRRLGIGVLAAVVAAAAAACGAEPQPLNPASPSVPAASAAASQPVAAASAVQASIEPRLVPRSVAGTLDGRFDFTRMWGSEWWQFYSDSHATGTVTHLGLAHIYTTHIPNLATGALEQGTFRLVAANGDEIRGTYEGAASYDAERADLVHGEATFTVSGGTGRFAGATGTLHVTFAETLDDPSWASAKVAWTLAGTVNY
jgi:hypothetical protein